VEETGFVPTDEAIINSAGTPKRLALPYLRGLFSAGSNVTIQTNGVIAAQTDPSVTGSLTTLTQSVTAAQAGIAVINARLPSGQIVGLNSSGQITQPVAGDVSSATVTAAAGGSARTLSARALDSINILDFGALPGGANCTAAFNAAFSRLPASGGEIYLPAGDYWLFSPLAFSGKPLAIRGAGRGQTRVHFSHTGIGFDCATGSLFSKVILSGFSMYAESAAGQTAAAVRITYPASSAFGYVTTSINDIECFGYPNAVNGAAPFPQTFLRGFVLNGCWSAELSNISWFGPPSAAGATSSAVVEVNGSIDTRLDNIQAYYGNTLVLQTGYCEGVYISNPVVVGVDYLVTQTSPATWSGYVANKVTLLGLWCADGEVNTALGTVQLTGVTDGFFANLDITRDTGPAAAQVLFNLTNVSNFHVSGCNFVGGPSGGPSLDIAFSFTSTANSSSNILEGCHFEDMATVIQINGANGTVALTTYGLHLGNVPLATAIIDQSVAGSSNYLSFVTPSQSGVPAGIGNTKDHVWSGGSGAVLFRINNIAGAANYLRHQPATSGTAPALCFDGTDATVAGVIQTKGGTFSVTAAGAAGDTGNMLTLVNTASAANWIVLQNAASSSLCQITTNAGGISLQPKGQLTLSPSPEGWGRHGSDRSGSKRHPCPVPADGRGSERDQGAA
jgi:hypothetical protein